MGDQRGRKHREVLIVVPLQHGEYHPPTSVTEVKHRPLRIVLGWGTKEVE